MGLIHYGCDISRARKLELDMAYGEPRDIPALKKVAEGQPYALREAGLQVQLMRQIILS